MSLWRLLKERDLSDEERRGRSSRSDVLGDVNKDRRGTLSQMSVFRLVSRSLSLPSPLTPHPSWIGQEFLPFRTGPKFTHVLVTEELSSVPCSGGDGHL